MNFKEVGCKLVYISSSPFYFDMWKSYFKI